MLDYTPPPQISHTVHRHAHVHAHICGHSKAHTAYWFMGLEVEGSDPKNILYVYMIFTGQHSLHEQPH